MELVKLEDLKDDKNASGVAVDATGRWLYVVTDELVDGKNLVQILEREKRDRFKLAAEFDVNDILWASTGESDLEGVALDGAALWLVGSHSCSRPRVKDEDPVAANRQRLLGAPQPVDRARDFLVRLELDGPSARAKTAPQTFNLRGVIDRTPALAESARTASKENGVDIEGLAVHDGYIYVGFRGPVLRDSYACVIRAKADDAPSLPSAEVRFLKLGGLGIRDLASAGDALLVLAGPVGDGPGGFHVYRWDGADGVPGVGAKPPVLEHLGELELPVDDKGNRPNAEGLTVESTADPASYEVLVVFDGKGAKSHAARYSIPRRGGA
ncbi:MAG: DUF3616 domain-containing protein [Polyangiaceae bacterium]